MYTRVFFILIAFDQLLNAILGGYPDETISARCWREKRLLRYVIDGLFFWQFVYEKRLYNKIVARWKGHCEQCYEWEMARKDLPEVYKK